MSLNAIRALVPVDGSRASLDAVGYAAGLFSPDQTHIVLYYVINNIPETLYDLGAGTAYREALRNLTGWEMRLREASEQFMEEARDLLRMAGFPDSAVTVTVQGLRSGVARDILAESHKSYHAVVCGRTGVNPFEEFVLGGVAKKLLDRMTHIPLCLVGARGNYGHVLLALDGSDGSFGAVDFVAETLTRATRVELFHALRGFRMFVCDSDGGVTSDHEQEWLDRYEMEDVFERARERLMAAGAVSISSKLVKGVVSRAGAIVGEAREGRFGTVVLGRRGHSAVADFSIGRVADKVVQMAQDRAVWIVS